jgi:hypothetical protein
MRAVAPNAGEHRAWEPGDEVVVSWRAADLRLFAEESSAAPGRRRAQDEHRIEDAEVNRDEP